MCAASKKKKKKLMPLPLPAKIFLASITPLVLVTVLWILYHITHQPQPLADARQSQSYRSIDIEQALLTPNEYSRPQTPLESVNNIVIHYTANPGSDAQANRDYFESLKDSHITSASSHFIVGLEGNIVQCIPLDEIAYASNDRNIDTISIECCHPGSSGKLNKKTYHALIRLCVYLCRIYSLSGSDLIRHYDVTGKICPKYYVNHPKKWEELKADVDSLLEYYGE